MSLLRAHRAGAQAALQKLGLAQPSIQSVGIQPPAKGISIPSPAKLPNTSGPSPVSSMSIGTQAAKMAFNVGVGMSNSSDGAGGVRGEPADEGRRQRSVIDRTWQQNDDFFSTSSMPAPGGNVSP